VPSLREAWDDHAEQWIAWARTPGHDSYWRFHRAAFLPILPAPGRLTLDVGSGEGRVSRDLLALGHRVLAVDGSPRLVAAAASHEGDRAAQVVGDAAALPLADGAADCAVAFMSLHDVDDLERAVAEVARVLAPGGRLVAAIVHPVNSAGHFASVDDGLPPIVLTESYFERRRTAEHIDKNGLAMTFHSLHRSLADFCTVLLEAGFLLELLREVTEPGEDDRWHRFPMFLDLRALRS